MEHTYVGTHVHILFTCLSGTGPVCDRMATVTVIVNESLSGVYYTITAGGTLNKSLVGPKSSFPIVGIDINLSSSGKD